MKLDVKSLETKLDYMLSHRDEFTKEEFDGIFSRLDDLQKLAEAVLAKDEKLKAAQNK